MFEGLFEDYSRDDLLYFVLPYVALSLVGTLGGVLHVRHPGNQQLLKRASLISALVGFGLVAAPAVLTGNLAGGLTVALLLGVMCAFVLSKVGGWASGLVGRFSRRWLRLKPEVAAGLVGGGIGMLVHPASMLGIGMSLLGVSIPAGVGAFLMILGCGVAIAAVALLLTAALTRVRRAFGATGPG